MVFINDHDEDRGFNGFQNFFYISHSIYFWRYIWKLNRRSVDQVKVVQPYPLSQSLQP
jgi:hypothetical protein